MSPTRTDSAPAGGAIPLLLVREALVTGPDLAARFVALPEKQLLKGRKEPVCVYVAADGSGADSDERHGCRGNHGH